MRGWRGYFLAIIKYWMMLVGLRTCSWVVSVRRAMFMDASTCAYGTGLEKCGNRMVDGIMSFVAMEVTKSHQKAMMERRFKHT